MSTLFNTHTALAPAENDGQEEINYIAIDELSIHIRIHAESAFEYLRANHSQIGFTIRLSHQHDNVNVMHWYSSRTPRRPYSTEQVELVALDIAFCSSKNTCKMNNGLPGRTVPVVAIIDCNKLWTNLMNSSMHTRNMLELP